MKLSIVEKSKKDIFISIFQLLKNCASIVHIIFNETDMYIQGMDKGHVCLFDIKIMASWFDKYEQIPNDKSNICIHTHTLHNVLSMNQEQHSIIIHYIPDPEPETIHIDLINEQNSAGDFNKYFKIPIADIEIDLLDIPNSEYDADFLINAKKIQELCSQLLIFGDIVNIKCSEEKINLISTGVNGEMLVNIPMEDLTEFSISEGEYLDICYSLHYIQKMCLTSKLSNDIAFSLSNNFPMKIKYNLDSDSYVQLFIAAKSIH